MVLIRIVGVALGIALLGACNQSLFAEPGDDTGPTPSGCAEPCIADAAADFDGSPTGSTALWRYLDDHRDRTWAAMTPIAGDLVGVDPANKISSCEAHPEAPACSELPGSLLLSSSGAPTPADPAIEFTAASAQVIQLSVRAHLADGPDQLVRLYRNSREDVLVTLTASVGVTVESSITVDALAGDRFLVALSPRGFGATDVAVQLFVSDTGQVFPAACQLAASFGMASATGVDDQCGGAPLVNNNDPMSMVIPPTLAAGPFPEQGQAADIAPDTYYTSEDVLAKTGDITIQLWVRLDAIVFGGAGFPFSDYDLNAGGGLAIDFFDQAGAPQLEVSTCTSGEPLTFEGAHIPFDADSTWHFVRVVHAGGTVTTCLDGIKVMSFPLAAGKLQSTFKPHFGKDVVWLPQGAFFDGGIDDVRVLATALPCE